MPRSRAHHRRRPSPASCRPLRSPHRPHRFRCRWCGFTLATIAPSSSLNATPLTIVSSTPSRRAHRLPVRTLYLPGRVRLDKRILPEPACACCTPPDARPWRHPPAPVPQHRPQGSLGRSSAPHAPTSFPSRPSVRCTPQGVTGEEPPWAPRRPRRACHRDHASLPFLHGRRSPTPPAMSFPARERCRGEAPAAGSRGGRSPWKAGNRPTETAQEPDSLSGRRLRPPWVGQYMQPVAHLAIQCSHSISAPPGPCAPRPCP